MEGNEDNTSNDNPQDYSQNFYCFTNAADEPSEDEELDTFPQNDSKLIVNQSERKSFLKFSSNLNVREYDCRDTASSIASFDSNIAEVYVPVNFELDDLGKIISYNHKLDELQQEHSGKLEKKVSTQALLSSSIKKEEKEPHKVNIINLFIYSNHVEGDVKVPQIFDEQECYIWFTIDNWKTFQEATAIEVQDGLNDSKSSSSSTPCSSKSSFLFKYKFDFIIPQQNEPTGEDDPPPLSEKGQFDDYGRPMNLQFHAVVRSDQMMYLDYDFKIYVIKLKEPERRFTLMENQLQRKAEEVKKETKKESKRDSKKIRK